MPLDEQGVKALLQALAEDDRQIRVPDRVERRVLQAWDERAAGLARSRTARMVWWRWGLVSTGVAASIVATVALRNRTPMTSSPSTVVSSPGPAHGPEGYLQWLDDDPSALQLLRVRASRATLASMGVVVAGLDTDGAVDIELVMGPDGARRGVRLLPPIEGEEF